MAERDALHVDLSEGFHLYAAGLRRERDGDVRADLSLVNGRLLFQDRATLNTPVGRAAWAVKATGPGRPSAAELEGAIAEYLLEAAFAELQREPKKPTQADDLVGMAAAMQDLATEAAAALELWHDPNQVAYATLPLDDHRETWPLRSRQFKRWLARRYHEQRGKTPNAQALADAIGVLEGKALYDGAEYPVFLRLAEHDGAIYLDLCDARWQAVAIDGAGWRVIEEPPVKFRRTRGMAALPIPARGGDIGMLRPFVNAGTEADWILLVAWLVGAFRPQGPYPTLAIHGEQGSAKSTTTRALRSLVDPNLAAIRTMPRDERDLMIAATNGWCLAFDNLSHLQPWLSDALCRLATGGGFATRELYADQEETILDAQRPVILNGITEILTRGDLLDRAIIVYLPTIPEGERRTERAFWRAFEASRPAILGALLGAVVTAQGNIAATHLDKPPRMADFATWVEAARPALGWGKDAFVDAYSENRSAANDLTLESSVLSQAIQGMMNRRPAPYSGTATDLLALLDEGADDRLRWAKSWPKDGRGLANALRRLAPNLRAAGIAVTLDHREGHGRKRVIKIEKVDDASSASSAVGGAPGQGTLFDADAGSDDADGG